MNKSALTYIWGIVAAAIYLMLVGLVFFYFNHRNQTVKKRYVKKDEHRIQVALSSGGAKQLPKKPITKKKTTPLANNPKPSPKPKPVVKKPAPSKKTKKVIKEKIVKKRVPPKKLLKKKPASKLKQKSKKRATDLFKNVKTQKRPLIKVSDKPIRNKPKKPIFKMTDKHQSASERIRDSLKKQKQLDSGVENIYLAHVQEMLEGWPAQSEFAGEKVKVHLKIDPTGHFEFTIKRRSSNPDFNRALTEFLEQLQEFGFGPHKGNRTYLFEAEFIAKE